MITRMLRRLLHFSMSVAVATTVAGLGSSCMPTNSHEASYCAYLPDTVGLYVGNPVTQMGYPIGKITAIEPSSAYVRVGFSLIEQRQLPDTVKAVIRSPSILADRSLELVGNYAGGQQLERAGCIPLARSMSPKSLSEVIGSADTFLNAINASGSTNVADTVRGLDQVSHNNGHGVGHLLTVSSALLDNPDQAISDIGSIIQNTAQLTTTLKEVREPTKEILMDLPTTTVDLATALDGGARLGSPLGPVTEAVGVLQTRLGDETQITLDSVSAALRKVTPHANALAGLFDGVPWWINGFANRNNNKAFDLFNIAYRPPLFRVPTHNGLALCGAMNASMPGSCADVNGQPYAVDVALLQYVLAQASQR